EMEGKRLALLHELIPGATLIGVLVNPYAPSIDTQLSDVHSAARALRQQIHIVNAGNEREIDAAFVTLAQRKVAAVLVSASAYFISRRDQIVRLAAQHAIPAIYDQREFAAARRFKQLTTCRELRLSPSDQVRPPPPTRKQAMRLARRARDPDQ